MYNKIWSPLKQEFVNTLSDEGKKALKLYVNSFMTGGAESQNAVEEKTQQNQSGGEGTTDKEGDKQEGTVAEEKVDDANSDENVQSGTDNEATVDTAEATTNVEPEEAEEVKGENEVGDATPKGDSTGNAATTPELEGDVTQELSEEQRKNIASSANDASTTINETIEQPLTKDSIQDVAGALDKVSSTIREPPS